jgi:iron(III) transport system permease protein
VLSGSSAPKYFNTCFAELEDRVGSKAKPFTSKIDRMNDRLSKLALVIWLLLSAGLCLYLALVCEPEDRLVALRTLGLGLAASLIAVPLGGLLAWVSLGRGWISKIVLSATICLVVIPVFLHVSTWDAAFGRLGWLTAAEGQVLVPLVSGWRAAVWIHGVAAAPQIAILMLLGISSGRRVYEEQALLETNRWGVFWSVTTRRIWPLTILATLWTMIVCAREIAATDLYRVGTLAEQIYLGYSLGQFNALAGNPWSEESLVAAGNLNPWITVVLIGWLAVTSSYFFIRFTGLEWQSENWQPPQRPVASRLATRFIGLVLLLVLAVIPIFNLFIRCARFVRPVDGTPVSGYSLAQLADTIGRATTNYTTEFTWSFLIAGTSASLILSAGIFIAWKAQRSSGWQVAFISTLALSCAIPGPLMGSLINRLFLLSDHSLVVWLYDRTIIAPVLASTWFFWPLTPVIIWFLFRQIARDAVESSYLDGAGEWSQLFRLAIMGKAWALAGCWLASFALCFGELSASQLVLPAGMDTVPRLMLGLLHAGVDEMTAALTIVTVALISIVSCGAWTLFWLNRGPRGRQ